jgi:RNA polymerase sigma-70 factor (ECF subfamily)
MAKLTALGLAMDESELIRRSKQGDLDSFNRLVELHQRQAYNLAWRMLGQVEAAEDATQDAFLSAWKGILGFRQGNFRAWLLSIVANACKDQLRARRRRPVISTDELELEALPSGGESPEEYVLRQELVAEIQRGLATLPPNQRLAIILRDLQGLSYEEIAQATARSLGTVRSRLSRGRAHLRDYLLRRGELLGSQFRLNK